MNVTSKTGGLVGLLDVTEKEDLMITCVSGITIRMAVNKISEQGRATQGVKLIKVDEGDEIAAITQLDEKEEELEEVAGDTAGVAEEPQSENKVDLTGEEPGNIEGPDTTEVK